MSHRKTSHRSKANSKAFWRKKLAERAQYAREEEDEDRRARREQNGRPVEPPPATGEIEELI